MVSTHLSSFAMPIAAQIIVTLYYATGQDCFHRVTKLIVCPTHLRNSTDTLIWLDYTRKMSAKCLLILSVKTIFIFDGFADGQINKIS